MSVETSVWDPADSLKTPEAEQAYLEAAFEDGDPAVIAAAIGDIARVRGMSKVAKAAGLSREAMYKSFCKDGNPTLESLTSVLTALGVKLSVQA